MPTIRLGPQVCGSLDAAASREWLVADGLGGFAMGTVAGLRTRRYHGLLVVATEPPIGRRLGLASLDPVLVLGDRRVRLATHEWVGGVVDPRGNELVAAFALEDGVPRWRWAVGDVVLEREVAMLHGRPAVGVVHRVVRAPGPVRVEVDALATWRDVHGERFGNGSPDVLPADRGFVFEGAYRVTGPGFEPTGGWYRGARYREEGARGLTDHEDLWHAGRFVADLGPGGTLEVSAWAGDPADEPPPPHFVAEAARARCRAVAAKAVDETEALLAHAADQFVVAGPMVVAGYPWFGDWSRDTMTSYEGLFLATGRWDEGRDLLLRAGGLLSEGMLANTADVGGTEYNTADATLWFVHAVGRHVEVTGDLDLAAVLGPALVAVVERHVGGTRFGIRVDPADGLLAQGAEGWALTWMDARVDGRPVTQRAGKAVELNALWIEALAVVAGHEERLGRRSTSARARGLEDAARASFEPAFAGRPGGGLLDVATDPSAGGGLGSPPPLRPNQLLAVSLPHAPLRDRAVVDACRPLVTPLGLRSLSPDDASYRGLHRGGPAERDLAYHQGTVWPWLLGPYVEACLRTGAPAAGVLDGLDAHLAEWGLGSVSETADGDRPHAASGCPFQAWSVAELLRAHRLQRGADDGQGGDPATGRR